MILNISPSFLDEAAEIYSISWMDSHKNVCSSVFLSEHTPSFMKRKIEREIESGWEYYISLSPFPSGIVSIKGNEISSLYVLPSMEKNENKQIRKISLFLDSLRILYILVRSPHLSFDIWSILHTS